MAFARFAYKKRLNEQARPKRCFDQANSLDAHSPVVGSFARERGAESLEPTVLTARNHSGIPPDGLSRSRAGRMSHAHQPSKPPPNGKATEAARFLGGQPFVSSRTNRSRREASDFMNSI
jgi:hypothetical protein